ncbi:MAG TPA: GNAT family N-acetyltransferase [Euzebya sp.]|nr:GNAT family N-acetyltransferase [Euzebya sp.]
MLVPTNAPPRGVPRALPDDGVQLVADATLFRAPATDRAQIQTARGEVLLRPVTPVDLHPIDTFVRRLSTASRFQRFHTGLHHLTPRQLAGVVDVDHHQRETLVAVVGRRVVGLGQYLRQDRPAGSVDLGIVVADRWQGVGLGRALVTTLTAAAAAAGHTHATALVQADNRPVLHLLRTLGDRVESVRAGNSIEALIRLT